MIAGRSLGLPARPRIAPVDGCGGLEVHFSRPGYPGSFLRRVLRISNWTRATSFAGAPRLENGRGIGTEREGPPADSECAGPKRAFDSYLLTRCPEAGGLGRWSPVVEQRGNASSRFASRPQNSSWTSLCRSELERPSNVSSASAEMLRNVGARLCRDHCGERPERRPVPYHQDPS